MSNVSKPIGKFRWIICALLFFTTMINYVDRVTMSVMESTLRATFHWTDTQWGDAQAMFMLAYAIGSLELTVPTFLPEQYGIKAALFSDFGTLGKLDKRDKTYQPGDVDCLNPTIPSPTDPTQTIPNLATPGTRNVCIRDDLSLRASAGLSVFWKSPMGPIRFDFSRILAKEDYDRKELFRFSTSTRF